MPGRVVLLDCSPRVPPGCLTADAWDVLRSARTVLVGDAKHPQLAALAHAGVAARSVDDADPARLADTLIAAADEGVAVWLVAADGDRGLTAALASRLVGSGPRAPVEVEHLLGSYDLPGSHVLDLVAVMDRLRSPGGCPWDAEQSHASLLKYLVEEAYEVVEAVEAGDRAHLEEELGDVLLQVVFHARVAEEHADRPFSIDDVADGIVAKLVRRHPHVFSDGTARTATDVEANWEQIKAAEKGRTSILDGIPPGLPALSYAEKLLVRADRTGLPLMLPASSDGPAEPIGTEDGIGAALLQLVAVAHRLGIDPEAALRTAARRLAGAAT